jgi:short-subunit dehydrogenase
MATALVTGATAGIGAAYANLLAKDGYDLVLVARDKKRLSDAAKSLTKEFGVKCEILVADLTKSAQLANVEKRLASKVKPIEVLINNAGFGINKSFLESARDAEQELLDVLVTAPMRLTHSVLPLMKEPNSGTVVNVSSVASWIAGGTYSAAKSYLTVFTESLHTELRGSKVNISALCPGFTRTEFHQRGRMKMSGLPNFMWLSAEKVVARSWKAAKSGKAITVPGWQYLILSSISRFGPRPLVRRIGMNVRKKQR